MDNQDGVPPADFLVADLNWNSHEENILYGHFMVFAAFAMVIGLCALLLSAHMSPVPLSKSCVHWSYS